MGRAPCCDKASVKRGPWSPEEDAKLKEFIEKYGTGGNWIALPQKAGLRRCGKSCRLRWLNYLRPNIKHGDFSDEEDRIICTLYASIGSRWSIIAAQLPGRTDNDIKNYWNTKLKKKLMDPYSNQRKSPYSTLQTTLPQLQTISSNISNMNFQLGNANQLYSSFNVECQSSLFMNHPSQCYPFKDSSNLFMFGGGSDQAASCSSSDGSCNQMSYGKEIKQEDMGLLLHAQIPTTSFDHYYYGNINGAAGDQIKANGGNFEKNFQTQVQYDGDGCNNNNSLLFFNNIDENKTNERGMYHYYK